MLASRASAGVVSERVVRMVACPPSVSLCPQTTCAETPPAFCGVSTSVPMEGSSAAAAATYAGSERRRAVGEHGGPAGHGGERGDGDDGEAEHDEDAEQRPGDRGSRCEPRVEGHEGGPHDADPGEAQARARPHRDPLRLRVREHQRHRRERGAEAEESDAEQDDARRPSRGEWRQQGEHGEGRREERHPPDGRVDALPRQHRSPPGGVGGGESGREQGTARGVGGHLRAGPRKTGIREQRHGVLRAAGPRRAARRRRRWARSARGRGRARDPPAPPARPRRRAATRRGAPARARGRTRPPRAGAASRRRPLPRNGARRMPRRTATAAARCTIDGRRPAEHEGGEERRCERPGRAGDDAQRGSLGQPRRREPAAEHGEGKREDPQQHEARTTAPRATACRARRRPRRRDRRGPPRPGRWHAGRTPRPPRGLSTVSRSGSRAPPPSTGQASREVNEAIETTRAASTAHAPPPVKKRSSLRRLRPPLSAPSSVPRRSRSCVRVSAERGDARPRRACGCGAAPPGSARSTANAPPR